MKFPVPIISKLYRTVLRNPKYRWPVILASLLYLISPLDISPDFIPILGQVDDVALLFLLVGGISELLTNWMQGLNPTPVQQEFHSESSTAQTQTVDVDAVSID
ncbi:YkvA family protein [Laspinema sp. A4]|uniref:YkvA family protein n=1 Tax=Laspinema sp. D2d TaxID=2953686 RepID=UPI0021BAAFBE|nr:YkvA family protein [Laspinema sp. D2d]MCT7983373.1 YkvA family protein [Laspinema sp. D2d]